MSENTDTAATPVGVMNHEKLRVAVEGMTAALPVMMKLAEVTAKQKKGSFDAYVKAGFSRAEALQLVIEEGRVRR